MAMALSLTMTRRVKEKARLPTEDFRPPALKPPASVKTEMVNVAVIVEEEEEKGKRKGPQVSVGRSTR